MTALRVDHANKQYAFPQCTIPAVYQTLLGDHEFFGISKLTFDDHDATSHAALAPLRSDSVHQTVGRLLPQYRVVVGVATYKRANGSTPSKFVRFLESLLRQTFQEWLLLVVGDCYDDECEFHSYVDQHIPPHVRARCVFVNLPVAGERHDTTLLAKHHPLQMWLSGGICALNYGLMIVQAREPAIDTIYVHCDDDDCWQKNHLQSIVDAYNANANAAFVYTASTFVHGSILPRDVAGVMCEHDAGFFEQTCPECCVVKLPAPHNMIHSSASWRVCKIPLRYAMVSGAAGDEVMWRRCAEHIVKNKLESILVKKVTVVHDSEGPQR